MDDSEIYTSEKRYLPTAEMIEQYQRKVGELYAASQVALLLIDKKVKPGENAEDAVREVSNYVASLPSKQSREFGDSKIIASGVELFSAWKNYSSEHNSPGFIADEEDSFKRSGFNSVVEILRSVSHSNPKMIQRLLEEDTTRTFNSLGESLLAIGSALHGNAGEESEGVSLGIGNVSAATEINVLVEDSANGYYKELALGFFRPYVADIVMKSDYHKNVN